MAEFDDQPVSDIREGESLDTSALEQFLRAELNQTGPMSIRQFPAGYSNLTYLVSFATANTGEYTEFVLRRPPVGNQVKSAHDMGREYRVLRQLSPKYPAAPSPVLYCQDEAIMGCPFYLMERITGIILRRELPKGLAITEDQLTRLSSNFVDQFARLHSVDIDACGLTELGRPQGYVERQILGWCKRYRNAATSNIGNIEIVMEWLCNQRVEESNIGLIHNDFKFDNLVLDSSDITQIIGVLDWEMTTIGETLMDLGSSLAYWVEGGDSDAIRRWNFSVSDRTGCPTRQDLARQYLDARGLTCTSEQLVFYYVYGLFKLIGIVQQIYARYRRGVTQDERFAHLGDMVSALGEQAVKAIRSERVSDLESAS